MRSRCVKITDNGGSAKLIFFLFASKSAVAIRGLAGGLDLRAALLEGDRSVAHVEHGTVLDLLHLASS